MGNHPPLEKPLGLHISEMLEAMILLREEDELDSATFLRTIWVQVVRKASVNSQQKTSSMGKLYNLWAMKKGQGVGVGNWI